MTATAEAPARRPLTTTQAAERLGVHPDTIVRWADAGTLKCWRTPGGQRRFERDALDAVKASR